MVCFLVSKNKCIHKKTAQLLIPTEGHATQNAHLGIELKT